MKNYIKKDKIQEIHFHGDFYTPILKNKKVQTARFGEDHLKLGKAKAIFDDHLAIPIEVVKLTSKKIDELSIEEIQKDGFSSKEKLWKTLLTFYPNLTKNDRLLLIEFKCI